MKKVLFLFMLLLFVGTAESYAQKAYRVTGNNVNVREGAGKNYPVQDDGFGNKLQLYKGQIVTGGQKKNGFVNVEFQGPQYFHEGWVSAQFLTPAKVCAKCKGKGGFGKCPTCNGQGWKVCCNYTGKKLCSACDGEGYK
ncbi:MAG: hypothetical protein IKR63_07295 [Alloprevotella sp.]|nr:hypothetical protein [Alloprevotella sp.]